MGLKLETYVESFSATKKGPHDSNVFLHVSTFKLPLFSKKLEFRFGSFP